MEFGLKILWKSRFNSLHKQIYIPNVTFILNVTEYLCKKSTQTPVKTIDFFLIFLGKAFLSLRWNGIYIYSYSLKLYGILKVKDNFVKPIFMWRNNPT